MSGVVRREVLVILLVLTNLVRARPICMLLTLPILVTEPSPTHIRSIAGPATAVSPWPPGTALTHIGQPRVLVPILWFLSPRPAVEPHRWCRALPLNIVTDRTRLPPAVGKTNLTLCLPRFAVTLLAALVNGPLPPLSSRTANMALKLIDK